MLRCLESWSKVEVLDPYMSHMIKKRLLEYSISRARNWEGRKTVIHPLIKSILNVIQIVDVHLVFATLSWVPAKGKA